MSKSLESCPNCRFQLLERTANCPYCGFPLTHPTWKKIGAWVLLLLIVWGLVKCHMAFFDELSKGGAVRPEQSGGSGSLASLPLPVGKPSAGLIPSMTQGLG